MGFFFQNITIKILFNQPALSAFFNPRSNLYNGLFNPLAIKITPLTTINTKIFTKHTIKPLRSLCNPCALCGEKLPSNQ